MSRGCSDNVKTNSLFANFNPNVKLIVHLPSPSKCGQKFLKNVNGRRGHDFTRPKVNEQTKEVAVEQQIFGEDDLADEISWVAHWNVRTSGRSRYEDTS